MVRKQAKAKKLQKKEKLRRIEPRITRSKSIAVENIENITLETNKTTKIESTLNTKEIPRNSTKRITRSTLVNSETVISDPKTKSHTREFPNFSTKRTRSNSEKITNIHLSSGLHVKKTSQNVTTKISRSKSANSETVVSDESARSLLNFSPKSTRSKSEKIKDIHLNSDSNQSQKNEQKKKQSENLTISRICYVKLSDFCVDSIVLAKQKYAVPWPAKVLEIKKDSVFVYFFGDKRNGYVKKSEIYDFILSANAIKNTLKSKRVQPTLLTGIREVQLLMGIPVDI